MITSLVQSVFVSLALGRASAAKRPQTNGHGPGCRSRSTRRQTHRAHHFCCPDQEEVFKAFRQLDSITAREQHGTGLGLALTKRFIELHGGQIRIASEPGMGSVFTLVLPLTPNVASAPFLPLAS